MRRKVILKSIISFEPYHSSPRWTLLTIVLLMGILRLREVR